MRRRDRGRAGHVCPGGGALPPDFEEAFSWLVAFLAATTLLRLLGLYVFDIHYRAHRGLQLPPLLAPAVQATAYLFWDGLPADIRAGLEAAMAEASVYANTIAKQENDQALEKVKASGKTQVYVPTKEERAAWKKALVQVHKEMESRIGKDTIQAVYAETGFKPD